MKILISKKAKNVIYSIFISIIVFAILFSLAINYIEIEDIATALNINKYEVRSELLIKAMDRIGVCKPEDAVNVWSEGLKMRTAAMQYCVMTNVLKKKYAAQLEETAPNWVTGMSSPWIDSYKIIKKEDKTNEMIIYTVEFETVTSTGPFEKYKAILTIIKEGDFWRISNVSMDEGLYPYTGFSIS